MTLARTHFACLSCRDSTQPLDDRIGLGDSLTETARQLLSLAGASWSFDTASQHLKAFCGIDASDEFIRTVSESATSAEWATRKLPAPSTRFAFARIEDSVGFASGWGPTAEHLGIGVAGGKRGQNGRPLLGHLQRLLGLILGKRLIRGDAGGKTPRMPATPIWVRIGDRCVPRRVAIPDSPVPYDHERSRISAGE